LSIKETILDQMQELEAELHQLEHHLYKETPGGAPCSSVISIPAGERGYIFGSTTLVDNIVDFHFHYISEVLKVITTETRELKKKKEKRETDVAEHLLEKYKERARIVTDICRKRAIDENTGEQLENKPLTERQSST